MKRSVYLLVVTSLVSLAGVAQAGDFPRRERGGPEPEYSREAGASMRQAENADPEWQMQRRERIRSIRQDMQRQIDASRDEDSGRGRGALRPPPDGGPQGDPRSMRALSPEARQQLRRDVREAAREVYIRR